MPERIQRKRSKDWRMPENTVYVGRPTKWGNPYRVVSFVNDFGNTRFVGIHQSEAMPKTGGFGSLQDAIYHMVNTIYDHYLASELLNQRLNLSELRGKNLACWCPPGQACHADVLLRIANIECSGQAHAPDGAALSQSEIIG